MLTFDEDGRPCVDVRGCGPREIVRRVDAFLDDLHAETLRAEAAQMLLADVSCQAVAQWMALRRIELAKNKVDRLESVVQVLETLQKENAS